VKKYNIKVPVAGWQWVVVLADDEAEAREKVVKGEIEQEEGDFEFLDFDDRRDLEVNAEPEVLKVDLKWSMWSRHEGYWQGFAPGVWGKLEAMKPGDEIVIKTAPRKEIRFGVVEIVRGKEEFSAHGQFSEHWDDVGDLCDTLGISDEEGYELVSKGALPLSDEGHPGLTRHFDVQAVTVDGLMTLIDHEEDALINEGHAAWKELETTYPKDKKSDDA